MNASQSDADRLRGWFADGTLVDPAGPGATLVDFSRAVASLCGAPDLELSAEAERLRDLVGESRHYVLVLIDGLGLEQLERCPEGGFLRSHLAAETRSVFLSSTAPALTSLYTGEFPAKHGVLSWWLRLPEHELTATILPFVERFGEKDLRELGVDPNAILSCPALIGKMTHRPLAVLPEGLVGSVYRTDACRNPDQAGYSEIADAFEAAAERVAGSSGPTFTYVYLPQADSVGHEDGCDDEKVFQLLAAYDSMLASLAERLEGEARIIVTGDHGLQDVPGERVFFLGEDDPMAAALSCPPSGEPTVPFFHVKEGRAEEFAAAFRGRWGDDFALLTRADVEELSLMGPGELSP
ncbi:MAG: alkaline phosphatase family protein, partial [Planctomycetota bacterium]